MGSRITGTTVSEGNSGKSNADITVTLSTASSQDVTVNYATVNGTALSSSDYTTTVGQLTFAAGETSKNISVPVLGDALIESDETFRVLLSSPTNATIDSTGDGIITIINDDSSSAHIELLGVNLALTNADLVII